MDFEYSQITVEDNNTVVIQLEFKNPTEMSTSDLNDQLRISINNTEFEKDFALVSGVTNKLIKLPKNEVIEIKMDVPP